MNEKYEKIVFPSIFIIIVLILWELIVSITGISEVLLPSPIVIIETIYSNVFDLLKKSINTLAVAFLGFLLSLFVSTILCLLFVYSRFLRLTLLPIAVSTRAIPIIAIAPIIILWFGTGDMSRIVLSSMVSFFPVLINQSKGLNSLSRDEIDLLQSFNASKKDIILKVRMTKSLPLLFAGLKIASSYAIIGVIVAEFVGTGSSSGIGYLIKSSTYYNETAMTFSAIIFTGIIGVFFYWLIVFIEKKIIFWSLDL